MSTSSRSEIQLVEAMLNPADGVQVSLDECLARRVSDVNFSDAEFNAWVASRGLARPEEYPLYIHVRDRSPQDTDDSGPVTNGSFYIAGGQSHINLYIGHRLAYFDRLSDEFDAESRQNSFNHALNAALAHEVEHYVEISNGNLIQSIKLDYVLQGLIDFSLNSYDRVPKTDDQLRAEILSLSETYTSLGTYGLYLDQPHEIRAREASRLYLEEGGDAMLRLDLR